MTGRFSPDKLLQRMGGSYLLLIIGVAQLLGLLGAVPGVLSIREHAQFEGQQLRVYSILVPLLLVLTLLGLVLVILRLTRTARKRLSAWVDKRNPSAPGDELGAWREITSLGWRYGIAAAMAIFAIDLLPLFILSFSTGEGIGSAIRPANHAEANPMYVLMGGMASLFGVVSLVAVLIDRFTMPLMQILLPRDFDSQLKGRSGLLLHHKFLIVMLGQLLIAILLTVSVGYYQALRGLSGQSDPAEIFRALQAQSLLFGVLALLLAAGIAYSLARALSEPLASWISTFDKIEKGDLTQRLTVTATDELGITTIHFNQMIARLAALQASLEQQVLERTRQLSATSEVGRVAASSLDPEQLLARIVPLIDQLFGYYFVAIYLLEPSGKWAELKEATGEAGRVLKENHHRLEVMGRSMVAAAIRDQIPRIAQTTATEKQWSENPLLPYTRSEISVPLVVGERILGALNVQSTKPADFPPHVVETMKNMATQVAIAIENARLFQEAQQVIREMRAVQQQYLLEGWIALSESNESLEYRLGDEPEEDVSRLEVPISLRDQILGRIMLEGKAQWTPEQQSLVDAIANQAALALENARLVNESRQIALRERMVAEITSKIWASATIDGVLQTVVKELGRRLDASGASIELHLEGAAKEDA